MLSSREVFSEFGSRALAPPLLSLTQSRFFTILYSRIRRIVHDSLLLRNRLVPFVFLSFDHSGVIAETADNRKPETPA